GTSRPCPRRRPGQEIRRRNPRPSAGIIRPTEAPRCALQPALMQKGESGVQVLLVLWSPPHNHRGPGGDRRALRPRRRLGPARHAGPAAPLNLRGCFQKTRQLPFTTLVRTVDVSVLEPRRVSESEEFI